MSVSNDSWCHSFFRSEQLLVPKDLGDLGRRYVPLGARPGAGQGVQVGPRACERADRPCEPALEILKLRP